MDTSSPCTCFQLRRAARRVSQVYDRHLAAAELSLNAYSILRRSSEPRPLGELADALGMDRTTLTRNLKPLLEAGLLNAVPGVDSRQRKVQISVAGKRRLQKAFPLWQQAQQEVETRFGSARTTTLNQQLEALAKALDQGHAA